MSAQMSWQDAFAVVSVTLGASIDETKASLDAGGRGGADRTLRALGVHDRMRRARAQAEMLTALAAIVDGMEGS